MRSAIEISILAISKRVSTKNFSLFNFQNTHKSFYPVVLNYFHSLNISLSLKAILYSRLHKKQNKFNYIHKLEAMKIAVKNKTIKNHKPFTSK